MLTLEEVEVELERRMAARRGKGGKSIKRPRLDIDREMLNDESNPYRLKHIEQHGWLFGIHVK